MAKKYYKEEELYRSKLEDEAKLMISKIKPEFTDLEISSYDKDINNILHKLYEKQNYLVENQKELKYNLRIDILVKGKDNSTLRTKLKQIEEVILNYGDTIVKIKSDMNEVKDKRIKIKRAKLKINKKLLNNGAIYSDNSSSDTLLKIGSKRSNKILGGIAI